MKNLKKLLAVAVSVIMMLAMTVTAFADETAKTYQIFQILTGTVNESGELTELAAGSNLIAGTDVAAAAAAMSAASGSNQEKLAVITPYVNFTTPYAETNDANVTLPDGYYLVKNTDGIYGGQDEAYTTYIVKVVDGTLSINPKSAKPTVDKQVQDETADAEAGATDGWGESADHAINESFQFKLVATLPTDTDLDDYNSYKLVFTDTMSDGVTFESIASVKVGTTDITDYVCTATEGQKGGTFTVTINDLKPYVSTLQGAVVTVIYNAHLNEDALVNKASATAQENNQNKVNLKYSNNPNYTGEGANTPEEDMGKTEYDYVFVLTYENDSTKLDTSVPAAPVTFAGVPFQLKDSEGAVIPMYEKDGAYYPVADSGETAVESILSGEDGTFAIKGLDAGTYTLVELQNEVNADYNLMEDLTIVIGATHIENANTTSVDLTLSQTNDGQNTLENSKGATLPETGGMGTTIIYIVGSILVIVAGVLLITRRRVAK